MEKSVSTSTLHGMKNQDQVSWHRFVERYWPILYEDVRRKGISEADVCEILQNTFVAVLHGLDNFQTRKDGKRRSFHAWIRGILFHKIDDYFRMVYKVEQAQGGTTNQQVIDALESKSRKSNRYDGNKILNLYVREAIQEIKATCKQETWMAFWRTFVDGLSATDVAGELNMTQASVRKAKSRVLKRLRELTFCFDDEVAEDEDDEDEKQEA